jgi:hypothetical protein
MSLNKAHLVEEAFHQYNLTGVQKDAISETITGYIKLIEVSTSNPPDKKSIKLFVDLIKSNLVNTLNVLEINLDGQR